jgi:hypothetical protein
MPEFKYIASLATWAAISPPTIADEATKITDDNNAVASRANSSFLIKFGLCASVIRSLTHLERRCLKFRRIDEIAVC